MAAVPHPSFLVSIGVGALILWRMYFRIRRMIGRQRLSNIRPWVTVIVFPMLLGLLLLGSLAHPINALALLAGVGCGTVLGVYGLRLTKFEQTEQGLFYTARTHLGVALSLLFLGRLAYRLIQIYVLTEHATAAGPNDFTRSPLTLVIFGTLAGYYVTYAIGLLRWRRAARVAVALEPPSA
jgi:hypothetical protein